jgi:hypothetical protein
MNLCAEAVESSAVCGENDACNSSYLCVSFLQPLAYVSQPKALCAGAIYYVYRIMTIRVNRLVNDLRGTYGNTMEGKAQLLVDDNDVDTHRTPCLLHSIFGS